MRVHPWSLGLMSQEKGSISVPDKMTLNCFVKVNVFNEAAEKKGMRGREVPIPARITKININLKGHFKLRAIMILEHQNLDFSSEAIKSHVDDVMVVQVMVLLRVPWQC